MTPAKMAFGPSPLFIRPYPLPLTSPQHPQKEKRKKKLKIKKKKREKKKLPHKINSIWTLILYQIKISNKVSYNIKEKC